MKLKQVKLVKNFKVILKDFELMVKGLKPLHDGRDITNFRLRPREAWANWLFCAVLRKIHGEEITFSDDLNGDGIIVDKKTGQVVPTEHVSALEISQAKKLPGGDARIIQAIEHKIQKGPEYAKDKFLLVFFDGAGKWNRKSVRETINGKHGFKAIYCIGLESSGPMGYAYTLTQFHPSTPDTSATYKVKINSDFTDWKVFLLQDQVDKVVEILI